MKFLRYLRGYCRVKAREENAAALLSLLMERKISFTPTKKAGDGLISFYTPYRFPEDAGCDVRYTLQIFTTDFIYREGGWKI